MKATLTVQMDNAAFDPVEGNGCELARILRQLAELVDGIQLEDGDGHTARDTNGNTVGLLEVSEG